MGDWRIRVGLSIFAIALGFLVRKVLSQRWLLLKLQQLPLPKLAEARIRDFLEITKSNIFALCIVAAIANLVSPSVLQVAIKLGLIKTGCELALFTERIAADILKLLPDTEQGKQRMQTLIPALLAASRWLTIGIAIVFAMYALGLDPSPLLGGGAIAALIAGYVAAPTLSDVVAGFFILFEGHYHLGSRITIDGFTGIVIHQSLRTTGLRAGTRDVRYFRNNSFAHYTRPHGKTTDNIFISYCRRDNLPREGWDLGIVDKITYALQKEGHDPYLDAFDIRAGADWEDALVTAIANCDFILVCLSPEWLKSGECYKEWVQIRAKRRHKAIFPIVLEEIEPDDVPETLRSLNWLFLTKNKDYNFSGTMIKLLRGFSEAMH